MEIRLIEMRDFPDVLELSKRAFEWEHASAPVIVAEICKLEQDLLKYYESERDGMFVAADDRRILGVCFALTETPAQGRITWVAVDTDIQGKRIGTKLLAEAVSYLRDKGIQKIVLSTDRPMAMSFYLKHGFRIESWMLSKEFDRNSSPEDEIEEGLKLAGEYANFHFREQNSEIMKDNIRKILESENDSLEVKNSKLLDMIKEYWTFFFDSTNVTSLLLKHGRSAILKNERCWQSVLNTGIEG
jgi:ribosomal protein S18 acetylase RimI-like enzyme